MPNLCKTNDIFVVGRYATQPSDTMVLDELALWLADHGRADVGQVLLDDQYMEFDMFCHPENGDVMDALRPGIRLVVALHLFAIDKIPGERGMEDDGYFYNRRNGHLLRNCMRLGIPLACWGDQPWLSDVPFKKIEIRAPLFIYERIDNASKGT